MVSFEKFWDQTFIGIIMSPQAVVSHTLGRN